MSQAAMKLELDKLTLTERLSLVEALWDGIAHDVQHAALTREQADEVDRRLAAHQQDPSAAIPWAQVRAEALARMRG